MNDLEPEPGPDMNLDFESDSEYFIGANPDYRIERFYFSKKLTDLFVNNIVKKPNNLFQKKVY